MEILGSAQIEEFGRVGRKMGREGCFGCECSKKKKINVPLLPEPLFAAVSVCPDLAAPGGACLASRGMGGNYLRVSAELRFAAVQAG